MTANTMALVGLRRGLSDRDCGYFIPQITAGELSKAAVLSSHDANELIEADASLTCSTWFSVTARAMLGLTRLPVGWDSHAAPRIGHITIEIALRWMAGILDNRTSIPAVVPTVKGGVQVEWHTAGMNIEIEFSPDQEAAVSVEDIGNGAEWDGDLYLNIERLRPYLSRLRMA